MQNILCTDAVFNGILEVLIGYTEDDALESFKLVRPLGMESIKEKLL